MQFTTTALRHSFVVCLLAAALSAQAAEDDSHVSAMRYVSLDVQGDNADSRQFSGTGSFTLGKYVWLQGTLGKLTDDSSDGLGDLNNVGIGTGVKGEHLQLSVNFSQYKNDASYKQRDVTAALDWYADRFSVGLDLFRRKTDYAVDTIRPRRTGGTMAVRIDENFTGDGYGLHATLALTDKLNLQAGGMKYSYDSSYQLSSSTNPILLGIIVSSFPSAAELFYLNNSGVTRSLAMLDSSYNLGLSYLFDSASLSAQYFRDEALDSDIVTDTVTLGAAFFLGDHWMLAPLVGQSRSDNAEDVAFGGLSISYNW